MKRMTLLALVSIFVIGVSVVLTSTAGAQVNRSLPAFVKLQAGTPGTPQAGNLNITGVNIASRFGAGVSSPGAGFDASGTGVAVQGLTVAAPSAIHGTWTGAANYPFVDVAGVRGETASASAAGVLGISDKYVGVEGCSNLGLVGVLGRNDSATGVGVYAYASGDFGTGLFASGPTAASFDGDVLVTDHSPVAIAFVGQSEAGTDTGIGHPSDGALTLISNGTSRAGLTDLGQLYAGSPSAQTPSALFHSKVALCATWNPDFNSAVSAETTSSAALDGITDTGFGVVGACQSNSVGMAGLFVGRVQVSGTFSATTKNFRIDHPLDRANKYLVHSSVESSERMYVYRGVVRTDSSGYATVIVPTWFDALNENIQYQLTVVDESDSNEFVQAKVVKNWSHGRSR